MVCTPQTYCPAPPVPGLTMKVLSADSALADIREGLDVNALGFDPQAARSTDAEAQAFRSGLTASRAFTALLDREPAGAGMFNPPHDGVTEVVGVATLEQFRRRGVAASLTAYATRLAFEQGVEVVFLGAADEHAGRVYER